MPVHDWTRVEDGIFHAFHEGWIIHLSEALNDGLLPPDYYALPDQSGGMIGPDVLTLHTPPSNGGVPGGGPPGAVAVQASPPAVAFTAVSHAEIDDPVLRQRALTIRHTSGDRIVAVVEILSPGNKSSQDALRAFLDKAVAVLIRGIHLLVIDLFPPGPRDPRGIHSAIWERFGHPPFEPPAGSPLTLVSYAAGETRSAYIQPIAVGQVLPPMPLFLLPDWYIQVPLEQTYQEAWRGTPPRWRNVIDPPGTS